MAYSLALKIHDLSLTLPKYERFEQASQIRRSSKSIKDNIVEGYGRRRYKKEFVRFLTMAHASNDEVISQLKMISDIHFIKDPPIELIREYDKLGRKINTYISHIIKNWKN